MNMMEYKGHVACIERDEEDHIFMGHLANIKDIVGFHGIIVDGVEAVFHEPVDNYIATSEETGRSAQKPYSGKLMLPLLPIFMGTYQPVSFRYLVPPT